MWAGMSLSGQRFRDGLGLLRCEPAGTDVVGSACRDHLQHGGSPHDEVEPCDRKVGKEYKTEKPKGEGERRDDICRGAF